MLLEIHHENQQPQLYISDTVKIDRDAISIVRDFIFKIIDNPLIGLTSGTVQYVLNISKTSKTADPNKSFDFSLSINGIKKPICGIVKLNGNHEIVYFNRIDWSSKNKEDEDLKNDTNNKTTSTVVELDSENLNIGHNGIIELSNLNPSVENVKDSTLTIDEKRRKSQYQFIETISSKINRK